ncbi:MAG: glycoside hydrolase N-terminal domain-containing protein, partial [Verrucomicrobiota bacterium]
PGRTASESIVLNEGSLWTGNTNASGNYDSSSSGAGNMGYYQTFGNLVLSLPAHTNAANYQRELNLSNAVAKVTYLVGTTNYTREIFCSYPDQVMVVQLTSSAANAYSGTLIYADGHSAASNSITAGLTSSGTLANGEQYAARILVENSGGTVTSLGGVVTFTNCTSLSVLVALATDYVMDYSKSYHSGIAPATTVANQISSASAKSYSTLKSAHTSDFQAYFNRVSINLGAQPSSRTNLPTDQRITANSAADDPDLEALLYQYGRYLMLSSSRSNGVPTNLQGLWNDSNTAPWHSDYHTDINIEMNYWGAEVANLSECTAPLFSYIQSQLPAWRWATSNAFGTRGWSVRTSINLNGGMGWNWNLPANDWMCMPVWEHYYYTGDTNFLQNVCYPIEKEICQFWQDRLKTLADGTLVSPNGWSPEHGTSSEDGVTYDQELIWDAFDNYIRASTILGVDADYRATVQGLQNRLLKPRVGPWGELREWLYSSDSQTDQHRHTSHLVGVYPGYQISPARTPDLAAAVAVSLIARGDPGEVCEWQFVNRAAIWARLLNGEQAHHRLALLFANPCIEPNLLCRYSDSGGGYNGVPQMDGSFGVLGSMSEMLLQSHEGKIVLLPALPSAWPSGSVTGLRARGGFSVDLTWTNGALTSATIRSVSGTNCLVQYGSQTNQLTMALGGSVPFTPTNSASQLSDSGFANRIAKGVASASGGTAANAFDNAISIDWSSGDTSQTGWLQYQFTNGGAWAITQYKLISASASVASDPASWQLLASNDGSTWTVLDTQTNQAFSGRLTAARYAITNIPPYLFYRLNITSTAGGAGSGVALSEFQLWSVDSTATASASTQNASPESAAQAFDGSTSTKWYNTGTPPPGWLQYQFGGGAGWVITNYSLASANDVAQRDPTNWLFQASNDGSTWTTLDSRTNQYFASRYLTLSYATSVASTTPYRYYRLYISANAGGSSYGLQLSEFRLLKPGSQPEPPVLVSATPGSAQVTLLWNASGYASSYNAKMATNFGGPFTVVATGVTATNYTATGLANGVTNYFVVSAVNSAESVNSTQISAVPGTPPSAPAVLSAQGLDSMAVLSWNAVTNATAYNLKYSLTSGSGYSTYGTVAGATNYSVFGLTNGTTFYFVVSAIVNGTESTNSAPLAVMPLAAPTGLTATAGNLSVALSWSASGAASGYAVKRSQTNGGLYAVMAGVAATYFTDTSVVAGTTYYYIVTATNAQCGSSDSSQVSATPQVGTTLAGRLATNFNQSWKFKLGDYAGAEAVSFSDSAWSSIGLPHSFSQPYFLWSQFYTGYGWYRKHFTAPAEWTGKRIFLEFQAAFQDAQIYVNGTLVG